MAKSDQLEAQGKGERVKGKIRSAYGKVAGDNKQRAKGALEEVKGRAKEAAGKAGRKARS